MDIKFVKTNLHAAPIRDRKSVLSYLEESPIVIIAAGVTEDKLDPAQPLRVPIGFATDGHFVWPLSLVYYLEKYSIGFDTELLNEIRDRGYLAPTLSDVQINEVRSEFRKVNSRESSQPLSNFSQLESESRFDPFR